MKPRTPEECDELFERHLNAGDLEALGALYEPHGALVQQDGSLAIGPAAIREGLVALVGAKARITMNVVRSLPAGGDLVALYNDWTMEAAGPDGARITMSGKAIELARRQGDGSWLFVLDDPFARG